MATIPATTKGGSRMKWRLVPVATFFAILAIAGTLLIFFLRDENSTPSTATTDSSAEATSTEARSTEPATKVTPNPTTPESTPSPPAGVKMFTYEIVRQMPHDARAFTQGLEYELYKGREVFWESTGLYGKSQLREVHVENGTVIRAIDLPRASFGEGLTRTSTGGLIQLTWKTGVTFEYPAVDTFHTGDFTLAAAAADTTKGGCSAPDVSCEPELAQGVIQRHTGLNDGWGIASNGKGTLIVTDSSETMYWLDEVTFEEKRKEVVTFEGAALPWVNELEWIDGEVWGNVWQTPCIARIDPESAAVTGWILLEGLKEITAVVNKEQGLPIDVLNGIAYDVEQKRLFVTGKKWAQMFEIRVVEYSEAEQKTQLEHARTVCKPPVFPM